MYSKKDIKSIQEILMNSWPANHYYFLKGWILRFTEGVTSRGNSVFPINYTGNEETIDKDLDIVEAAYTAYNLPTIFTIPDYYKPNNLNNKLIERGYYQLGCITRVMISPIQELKNEMLSKEFTYVLHSKRVPEFSNFLAKFSKRDKNAQRIIDKLSNRIIIPRTCFEISKYKNKVIGTLMGVLDPSGFLYIADVLVDPNFRQRGIATSMFFNIFREWRNYKGIQNVWLQVEIDNEKAMNLYTKLGMKKMYEYYYLKKDLRK